MKRKTVYLMTSRVAGLAIRVMAHLTQDTYMPFGQTIDAFKAEGYSDLSKVIDLLYALDYIQVQMDGQSNYYRLSPSGVRARDAIEALMDFDMHGVGDD